MRIPPLGWLTLVASVLVVVAGCGTNKKLVPTAGTVTLDGQPVEGAVVQFHPHGSGEFAHAMSKSDGSFRGRTDRVEGVAPGAYDVTVVKFDTSGKQGKQSTLPQIYSSVKTTPFHITVPHDGPVLLELKN